MNKSSKAEKRVRRHARIRAKISGTAERPRLSVFKSNTTLRAQLIDDEARITIASASGKDAQAVGTTIAKAALEKGVKKASFDRGGFLYAGKVKALADSARAGGLEF